MKFWLTVGAALATGAMAMAVDPPMHHVGFETEDNNTFETREIVEVPDDCFYFSGKLQKNEIEGRYPDTYLFMFDKQDNVVCEDDNSSTKGNGKASACYGVAPIPNNPEDASEGATIRLGVTGRADGVDNMLNGLFFNAPHGQLGEAQICVTYFGENGLRGGGEPGVIGTDTYTVTFKTGLEAFRVNFEVPAGTTSVDVELDNTVETFEVCNDVDYFQLEGLEPSCDYCISFIGGVDYNCDPTQIVMGWWNKDGELIQPVAGGIEPDRGREIVQLCVISDADGRLRFSISGRGDEDFDGFNDLAYENWEGDASRDIATPPFETPPFHGVCGCWTVKVELNPHEADGHTGGEPSADAMAQLQGGDLNLDGGVDVIDLAILLNNWGNVTP